MQKLGLKNKYYFLIAVFLCGGLLAGAVGVFIFARSHFADRSHTADIGVRSFDGKNAVDKPGQLERLPNIARRPAQLEVVNSQILPAGTQMTVPYWVVQQFREQVQQQALYGHNVLNFLTYHYGIAAPSVVDSEKDSYYIPLNRYSGGYDNDNDYNDTVMVDVSVLTPSTSSRGAVSGEDGRGTPPPPKDTADARPIYTTTQDIDLQQTPPVPGIKPEKNLDLSPTTYSADCPVSDPDANTEAGAPCVDCVNLAPADPHQIQSFLESVGEKVDEFKGSKSFSGLAHTFCGNCHEVDVRDFFQYVEERATAHNVPPEILFAIMLRESNGECDAQGDNDCSYGLFQLNVNNSSKLRACRQGELRELNSEQKRQACSNGNYRNNDKYNEGKYPEKSQTNCNNKDFFRNRPNIDPGVCLNNPYCSFEEALHLLKGEKWDIGNGTNVSQPQDKNWTEMSPEERNLWRNAVIAYNGGTYLKEAEKAMRQSGVGEHLNDWERKRMFFIKEYLKSNSKRQSSIIHNLAYVERITGREKEGGFASSGICQWMGYRKQNPNLTCETTRTIDPSKVPLPGVHPHDADI